MLTVRHTETQANTAELLRVDLKINLLSQTSFLFLSFPVQVCVLLFHQHGNIPPNESVQHHAVLYLSALNFVLTSTGPVYTSPFLSTSYDCISCKKSRPHSSCQIECPFNSFQLTFPSSASEPSLFTWPETVLTLTTHRLRKSQRDCPHTPTPTPPINHRSPVQIPG